MGADIKTKESSDESHLIPKTKDVVGFLDTLVRIILPKHTVIIIILGIMGYFLFYPTVRDPELYKAVVGSGFYSPFTYTYFILGFIYLVGGMFLTKEINKAENKAELDKARLESDLRYQNEYGLLEGAVRYLVDNLGFPEERVKREVALKSEHKMMRLDVVAYRNDVSPLAIAEVKWNRNGIQHAIEQVKAYLGAIKEEGTVGGYLFVRSDNGFDVRFYDSKGAETGTIPTYEELLEMTGKKK